jgi:hypothetical protein
MKKPFPLDDLVTPDVAILDVLRINTALRRSCDEYDWIMISDLFPAEIAVQIAKEWKRPGGSWSRSTITEILTGDWSTVPST